jgi:hypothetical protein
MLHNAAREAYESTAELDNRKRDAKYLAQITMVYPDGYWYWYWYWLFHSYSTDSAPKKGWRIPRVRIDPALAATLKAMLAEAREQVTQVNGCESFEGSTREDRSPPPCVELRIRFRSPNRCQTVTLWSQWS